MARSVIARLFLTRHEVYFFLPPYIDEQHLRAMPDDKLVPLVAAVLEKVGTEPTD